MKLTIPNAMELLKSGQIVALPTETVYGLAGRADMMQAIDKIYLAKNRPRDNPLIVHFASVKDILKEVEDIPPYFHCLVENLSPGPVTYILKLKSNSKLKYATMGRDSIACRIPDNKIFLGLVQLVRSPLAAPSANTSGRPSPTNSEMVIEDLGSKISGVVDGGDSRIGIESTILDCRDHYLIKILRAGNIGSPEINSILPYINIITPDSSTETVPGNKYKHYSPSTKIELINIIDFNTGLKNVPQNSYIICCNEDEEYYLPTTSYNWLSIGSRFNSVQIAKNIYSTLHMIDKLGLDKIYWLNFEIVDNNSLASGVKNRINRILSSF